jgi:two-component system, cell cycle response regulator DivK
MRTTAESPLIMVVDDVADAREICTEYLEFRGYRVISAADGMEALAKAVAELPDLILMDLALPVLDGWEATRRLGRDERTRHIPVVALTAHAVKGISDQAIEAGCLAVLTKPIEPRFLAAEVERFLEQRAAIPPVAVLA